MSFTGDPPLLTFPTHIFAHLIVLSEDIESTAVEKLHKIVDAISSLDTVDPMFEALLFSIYCVSVHILDTRSRSYYTPGLGALCPLFGTAPHL